MSDEEEAYCRLCAEVTSIETLISPDEDVGINSKIQTKMLWINVDVTTSNSLPKSICFSCFDALERTWTFLHEVRAAQTKLKELFLKNCDDETFVVGPYKDGLSGKPVNVDWEELEKQEIKPEIDDLRVAIVDPSSLINLDCVKIEKVTPDSDIHHNANDIRQKGDDSEGGNIPHEVDENIHDGADDCINSTDSDAPLYITAKKTKLRKKRRKKEVVENSTKESDNQPPVTWDEYPCRCGVCDAQCMNISTLRMHALEIHGCCCRFKCSDCGKIISNFRSFIHHVRLHTPILKYCCEFCSKHFTVATQLNKHKYKDHSDANRKRMCQNCGVTFETEEQLQDHTIVYTKKYRKRAPKIKKNDTLLNCEHCNKQFKSRSNLNQHQLVHSDRKRDFACHICGKMFFTNGSLWTHIMVHDDKKHFKCDFCGLAFRARGNLTAHISLHSGVKPFVCEQCGKSFRSKRNLKSHSIVHTNLKPYTCEYCNKNFRFKTRLNLHIRQHTGAKPYRCDLCVRHFTNGSNHKKHMKRRHNIDTSSRRRYNELVMEPKHVVGSEGETNQT